MKYQFFKEKNYSRFKEMQLIALFLAMVVLLPNTAMAYIDPGAGSMLLQVLLGGIAGLFVMVKLYWRRFLGILKKPSDKSDTKE